jgi:inner membrane protein involved in colicin E2 resistance
MVLTGVLSEHIGLKYTYLISSFIIISALIVFVVFSYSNYKRKLKGMN